MATAQAGMKKRQLIANSNKTMFLWVAGMSAVVGVCAVVAYFLIQNIVYTTKVTNKLDNTIGVLDNNNKVAPDLIKEIQVLETNDALNSVRTKDEISALQTVLDALPDNPNSLALGSSLQKSLVADIPGLRLDMLAMQPVTSTGTISVSSRSTSKKTNLSALPFKLVVSSTNADALQKFLSRMQHSIRVIDIDTLTLERTDARYTLNITAHAYYEPGKIVQLKDEVVPVHEKK